MAQVRDCCWIYGAPPPDCWFRIHSDGVRRAREALAQRGPAFAFYTRSPPRGAHGFPVDGVRGARSWKPRHWVRGAPQTGARDEEYSHEVPLFGIASAFVNMIFAIILDSSSDIL